PRRMRCTRSPSRDRSSCSASGDDAGQSAFSTTGVSDSPGPGADGSPQLDDASHAATIARTIDRVSAAPLIDVANYNVHSRNRADEDSTGTDAAPGNLAAPREQRVIARAPCSSRTQLVWGQTKRRQHVARPPECRPDLARRLWPARDRLAVEL